MIDPQNTIKVKHPAPSKMTAKLKRNLNFRYHQEKSVTYFVKAITRQKFELNIQKICRNNPHC